MPLAASRSLTYTLFFRMIPKLPFFTWRRPLASTRLTDTTTRSVSATLLREVGAGLAAAAAGGAELSPRPGGAMPSGALAAALSAALSAGLATAGTGAVAADEGGDCCVGAGIFAAAAAST